MRRAAGSFADLRRARPNGPQDGDRATRNFCPLWRAIQRTLRDSTRIGFTTGDAGASADFPRPQANGPQDGDRVVRNFPTASAPSSGPYTRVAVCRISRAVLSPKDRGEDAPAHPDDKRLVDSEVLLRPQHSLLWIHQCRAGARIVLGRRGRLVGAMRIAGAGPNLLD